MLTQYIRQASLSEAIAAKSTTYAKKKKKRKKKDNVNFDAQGRAESRKNGLVTLRLAVFEQY